jgi:cytochrome c oxidase subunit II
VRRLLLAASTTVLALVLVGGAAAGNGGFAPVPPESPNAEHISTIYWVILVITGIVFVLVETALVVFVIRFRGRGRPRTAEGPQIIGHHRLEVIWTIIPALILAGIAAFVFVEIGSINNVPSATAAGPHLNIVVDGRQFYWRFAYPNGAIAVERMVVPSNRVVTLDVVSSDVIHSWWIPAFGGKIDAIPGRVNHTWFQVAKEGRYEGQCAELCGLQHAQMKQIVDVVPPTSYERWVARQRELTLRHNATLGKQEFNAVCAKCHYLQTSGEKLVGPNLGGNPTLIDPKALSLLLHKGGGKMPAVGRGWSDQEVQSLVDFFKEPSGNQG